MLKSGQTKIPIPYRTCDYCKHENGRLTNPKFHEDQRCTLRYEHKHINHWVSAQKNKSCCGWEPAEDGFKRLTRDKLAGEAGTIKGKEIGDTLSSHPPGGNASKFNQQHFSWISFMKHRPCTDDT